MPTDKMPSFFLRIAKKWYNVYCGSLPQFRGKIHNAKGVDNFIPNKIDITMRSCFPAVMLVTILIYDGLKFP